MPVKYKNSININDEYTFPLIDGESGQALVTDGAGNVSFSEVSAADAEAVHLEVKNTSGATIAKGTPVYITGNVGNSNRLEIAPADASDASKMPAVGLLESELIDDAEGFVAQGGYLKNLATATIDGTSTSSNDTVYVKAGGGLTMTKPTGTNYIQNIAKVARVHASNGSLVVSSILRTNDVPTPLYIDHANQRLGIGVTAPSQKLEVSGNIEGNNFYANDSSVPSLYMERGDGSLQPVIRLVKSNDNLLIGHTAIDEVIFYDDAGEAMRLDGSGKLGIGTTAPGVKLHVKGEGYISHFESTNASTQLRLTNNTSQQRIVAGDGNLQLIADAASQRSGSYIDFIIDSTSGSKMRLDTTGLGIGTTSPSASLQVGDGTADSSSRVYYSDGAYTEMRGFGLEFNRASSYIRPTGDNTKSMFFGTDSKTWANIQFDASQYDLQTNAASRLKIDSSGNVGIGTTSPLEKLVIQTNVEAVEDVLGVYNGITGTSALGKGTAIRIGSDRSGSYSTKIATIYEGNNPDYLQPALAFFTMRNTYLKGSEVERMRIASDGNVGIGTTSPDGLLELAADNPQIVITDTNEQTDKKTFRLINLDEQLRITARTDGNISNADAGDIITFKRTGNVGIGTTSPETKLTIEHDSAGPASSTYATTASNANLHLSAVGVPLYNHLFMGIGSATYAWIQAQHGNSTGQDLSLNPMGGKIGIGTISPEDSLHIDGGNIQVSSENSGEKSFAFFEESNGGTGATVGYDGSDNSLFIGTTANNNTNVSKHIVIPRGTGNVGINTTAPSAKLHVAGAGIVAKFTTTNSDSYTESQHINDAGAKLVTGSIGSNYSDSSWAGMRYVYATAGDLAIKANASTGNLRLFTGGYTLEYERMRIASNGNVGIGSTSPTEKLDVNGKISASRNYVYGQQNYHIKLSEDTNNAYIGNVNGSAYMATGSYYGSQIYNVSSSNTGLSSVYLQSDGTTFFLNNSFTAGVSTIQGVARMTIKGDGNVGIGTTSPSAKLEISRNQGNHFSTAFDDAFLKLSSPSAYNSTGVTGISMATSPVNNYGVSMNAWRFGTDGNPKFIIKMHSGTAAGLDALTITNGGNVGIGTTSPSEKLDVVGSIKAGNLKIENAAGGRIGLNRNTSSGAIYNNAYGAFQIQNNAGGFFEIQAYDSSGTFTGVISMLESNGNFGIGTTSPGAKLSVAQPSSGDATILAGRRVGKPTIKSDSTEGGYLILDSHASAAALNHYSSNNVWLATGGGNVGIGTTSPSDGDLNINDPKLHVVGPTTASAFNLVARFQGGNDSDNTGAAIAINHSNDRGLLIRAGRKDSDRPVAYFDLIASSGSRTNMMTLGQFGTNFRVDIDPFNQLNASSPSPVPNSIARIGGSLTIQAGKYLSLDDDYYNHAHLRYNGSGGEARFEILGYYGIDFKTRSATKMVIKGDTGNVGIGTTSPPASAKLTVMGNQTFGLPGNGSNTSGRFLSIEGNTDSGGEGSSRIFFTEHNSSTAGMDKYGLSIGYRGGATSITGASGNAWTGLSQIGNGEWALFGHNNNATGRVIMKGPREGTSINFNANNLLNANNLNFTSGSGNGIRFWDSPNYSIFMATDDYGGRLDSTSDYNMYFRMTGGTNRGFVFLNSTTPVAQIDSTGTIYSNGNFVDSTGYKIPNATDMAVVLGWEPAYSNSTYSSIRYNSTQKAVELQSDADASIGAAFKAVRIRANETKRFTVMVKASAAASSGLYIRLYGINGDLPNGKTHISASGGSSFVEPHDYVQSPTWVENGSISTSWVNYEYSFTATADGYVSLVVLNWSGIGTNSLYIRQPDIQTQSGVQTWSGTKAQYDALTKDANTIYYITDE